MDIPGNLLFARWRPDGRFLGPPDGAAREIPNSENNEAGHAVGVAAPQAPRFRAQPKQPLQPVSLYPAWRLTFGSCQEVERSPDADHDRGLDASEMPRHPEFLLGRAQPHQNDVRWSHIDGVNLGLILVGRQLAEG